MHVGIYSLKKTLFDGDATSINCRTLNGEITILNHHRPLISVLDKGIVKIIDKEDQEHYIPVNSGFLEVTSENRTKLIVEE
jgi:F-type H+-transporting ATPase subunit epsilon